ncbi:MAG: CopG family transcriptional regulator [Rhizobiaceae bacterium]
MRTTLSIDDDVLAAAKALAVHQQRSVGDVISDLARQSLRKPVDLRYRNGIPILPVRPGGGVVTTELVNALMDELP